MKKIKASIAMLLVLSLLLSAFPLSPQAYALSDVRNGDTINSATQSWNTSFDYSTAPGENHLPHTNTSTTQTIAREPDVGNPSEKASGIFSWLPNNIKSKSSTSSATIYENFADKGVKVSGNNEWVRLTPTTGDFSTSVYTDCAVRYTNVFESVDYQFSAMSGNAHGEIIFVSETKNSDNMEFALNLSGGLDAKIENGEIIISKNNQHQFLLTVPVLKDVSGAQGYAYYEYLEDGSVSICVDEDWMHELSRAYPVSLAFDISCNAQDSNSNDADLTVIEREPVLAPSSIAPSDIKITPTLSFVERTGILSCMWIDVEIANYVEGTTLQLKLSPLDGDGAEYTCDITSEKTTIYDSNIGKNTQYQVEIIGEGDPIIAEDTFLICSVANNLEKYQVLQICWRYEADLSKYVADNGFSGRRWIITSGSTVFVRNPAMGGSVALGVLRGEELNDFTTWLFSNNVEGINELGFEPINFNTGNFLYHTEDVTITDYSEDFVLSRTYNSLDNKQHSALGYGWRFNYDISLRRINGGTYVFSLGDGRTVWFEYDGANFVAKADKHYTLNMVDGGYTIINEETKSEYFFDYLGKLITLTHSNGNTTHFAYNSAEQLSSITTPAGYVINVTCDSNDRIASITLPNDGVITYTYDSNGNLISVIDEEGRTTSYTYDSSHRILTVVNPEGIVTVENTYDNESRVVKQLDANGNIATLSYEPGKTIATDNNGNATQVFYDDLYRTTKVIYPDGSTVLKTWDSTSNMTSYTDKYGVTTYYEYNSDGLITKETRADGTVATYAYNALNKVTSYTDFAGNTTTYEYDACGNLIKVTYADGSSVQYVYNSNNQVVSITDQLGNIKTFEYSGALCTAYTDALGNRTEYGYSSMGWLTAVKDAEDNITRYLYNACGERYAEQHPDGSVYTYVYDDAGYVTAIVDELGHTSTFSYDKQGNMLSGVDPLGNTLTMTYDSNYNKLTSTDALGQTTKYSYDSMNRVTAITDPNGGNTSFVYDSFGNTASITDANGNVSLFSYNTILNETSSVTEPSGATTKFEYDAMGNITKITYADGSSETYQYDSLYRLVRITSVLGLVTEYVYDAAGNVTKVSNSEGQSYTYTYDANGNVISVTDALGYTTTYTYNTLGLVTKTTDAAGLTSTITYDSMSRPVVVTDTASNTTTYEYDLCGNVVASTDAKGNRTEFYYNKLGNLIATKDALGNVTTYEYNAVEQLTASIDALTNKTQYEYDANGNLTKLTEANGAVTELSYDKNGNNTKIVDPENYVITLMYNHSNQVVESVSATGYTKNYTYDSMCRNIATTDSTGGFIEYTYDAAGNVLTETDATGRVSSYTYDTLGRALSHTGYDGETYTYAYDALSRVISETSPENHTTAYTYDYRGNLIKVTEFDGAVYSYEYDALNQLVKSTNPIGASVTYEYDALGNLVKSIDAEGNVTAVDYDALSRITAVTEANGGTTSYTYDAIGNVLSATSPLGNVSEYQYDSVYNLVAFKDTENYVTTYAYDLVGNLTSTTSARNAVTKYEYDGAGNITKVTDAEGYVTAYDYMPDGVLTMLTQANGGTYTYEYDVLDRLTKITDPEGYFRAFTYDTNGDVVAETDSLEINNTYAYDLMHRMTAASEEGITTTYSYDARGNLASVVMPNNGTYTYTYDAIDRLSAMTDPLGLDVTYSYNLNNQLLSETKEDVAATRYAYDSMGNNVSVTDPMGEVTQFVYDIENNLTTSTDPMGYSVSAVYDTLGRTVGMTDQLGESVSIVYDPHSNVIGMTDAKNQTTAYTYDLVDNLTGIVDANGATVSYTYDSMGNLTSATNGNGNTSAYTYNLRGDLTSVTNPMGEVEQYVYDIAGKLTEYVKPSGVAISYDYDKLNNLATKTADDETPVAYAYDNMGFRVEMNDATGEVSYEYDAVGNATKVVHHNGETVRYSYDVFGRLSEIMYPDGYCTNYEYDLCDRLVKVIGRDSGITTYEYDANGNVLRCDRSNDTYTTYIYNARGELTMLENRRDSGALLSSYAYEYDKNGFITKETEKVDSYTYVREYTYDAVGQLVGYLETTNGKTGARYSYAYDDAGNRTGMVYYDASNTKYWTDYVYNENDELVAETYNYNKNKNKVISTKTTYTYDVDGNLVTKNTDGSDTWQYLWTAESRLEAVVAGGTLLMAATYDGDNNRIFQISDAASSSKVHQESSLKSAWKKENGNSYSWEDGNGNGGNGTGHSNTGNGGYVNGGGHNHTGNNSDGLKHANCKKCVDTQEAFVQSMADDAVSIDGTDYLPVGKPNSYKDYELIYYINDVTIENEQVLVEYGANGTATGTYEYGLQRLSVEYVNEAKEYYLYNGTGNVTQTTAENGSAFLRYTYDPFGNVTSIRAPMTVDIDDLNRYTYNGEDYDYNTGLQYLRARYYSTSTGSFISQDTYLGRTISPLSQNRYTYAHNNPIMYDDPSGHMLVNYAMTDTGSNIVLSIAQAKANDFIEACLAHDYALLASDTYSVGETRVDSNGQIVTTPSGNIGNWTYERLLPNTDSSVKIAVYYKIYADGTKVYALVNEGTNANIKPISAVREMCYDIAEDLKQPFGNSADIKESVELVKEFISLHPDSEIVFVGHSKGGAEAIANSYATGYDAIVFNPANSYPDRNGIDSSSSQGTVTEYVVEGEILNTTMDYILPSILSTTHDASTLPLAGGIPPFVGDYAETLEAMLYDEQEPDTTVPLEPFAGSLPFGNHGIGTIINILEYEMYSICN